MDRNTLNSFTNPHLFDDQKSANAPASTDTPAEPKPIEVTSMPVVLPQPTQVVKPILAALPASPAGNPDVIKIEQMILTKARVARSQLVSQSLNKELHAIEQMLASGGHLPTK